MVHFGKSFLKVFVLLLIGIVMTLPVLAQDEKRALLSLGLGRSSSVETSGSTEVNVGGSFAYKLFENSDFYVEPGLYVNWPRKEVLNFGDENDYLPLSVSAMTAIFDLNGSYLFVKEEGRFAPFVTGGLGFLRNSFSATDGYYAYNLGSDSHFPKNVGVGFNFFLGEDRNVFFGGLWKNYWSSAGNFHVFSGRVGFRL